MLKKREVGLIVVIILASLLMLGAFRYYRQLNAGDNNIVEITLDTKLIERIDLDKVEIPREIYVTGKYHNLILVEKGRIRFEKSDCPNQICVNTGWLDKPGDVAVCLPNKVIVSIKND